MGFSPIWRRRFEILVVVVSLLIGLLVFVAAASLTPAEILPPALQRVQAMAATPAFQALLAIVELTLLLVALALTAYHFRHQRATDYITRFNSQDFIDIRNRIDLWLRDYDANPLRKRVHEAQRQGQPIPAEDATRLDHLEARMLLEVRRDLGLRDGIRAFANLFQEVGAAYENRTVSVTYTTRVFDFLAPHYWDLLRFWIDDYRIERRDPTLYRGFEKFVGALRRRPGRNEHPERLEEHLLLREAASPKRLFVFGYGSLLESRSRGRVIGGTNSRHAVLDGYARAWNTVNGVIFPDEIQPRPGLFLGLALTRTGACNGQAYELTAGELEAMDGREKNYVRIDVTPWCRLDGTPIANAVIYTYVPRPEFTYEPGRDRERWPDLCIPQNYVDLVQQGLEEQTAPFREAFAAQTWPQPDLPHVEGRYRFPDAAQNLATGRGEDPSS